jgi:hypothetical protein
MKKSIMALSATLLLELLHKSSVRRIQFRQWPTCHFTKRPFGTGCDNIRNVRRSKNENPERTGLLIFEHLLFEGTENIKRGEWFKIVTGNGEQITPTPLTTVLIITKYSHLIILN